MTANSEREGGSAALRAMLNRKHEALKILRGVAAKALASRPERAIHLGLAALLLTSCATRDTAHRIVISAKEQKLVLLEKGNLIATYPVSTSKYGLGDARGSYCTPLGQLEIADKIGDGAAPGMVFKDRRRTGEIVDVNAPGRDPIITRIIWLRGLQPQNANAFVRDIYIHGTPEERNIGLPASYGCIRMRSTDIVNLYNAVGLGAKVTIVDVPLAAVVPSLVSASSMAETNTAPFVIR
jgi:L,D-transpeptidase catalytic domain